MRQEFPQIAFLSDLSENVNTWKRKGDQIILMGDINKYIQSKKISNFATKLGPRKLITDRHGPEGPGTTGDKKKKQAIDGIWVSTEITIS